MQKCRVYFVSGLINYGIRFISSAKDRISTDYGILTDLKFDIIKSTLKQNIVLILYNNVSITKKPS